MTSAKKQVCTECGWQGTTTLLLTAPNPFDPHYRVLGCPVCKSINMLRGACDEPGCWQEDTCGTPTPDGYRWTCGKHLPKESDKIYQDRS